MSIIAQAASSTTSTNYTLTVTSGSGSGVYVVGSTVTITANAPASGFVFDAWTGATVTNPAVGSTTIVITGDLSVAATYVAAGVPTYTLAVVNGTGDGNYVAGHVVAIVADSPPTGQVFDTWTGATVASPSSASTTLTMPASPATVTANFVDGPFFVLTVTNGSGGGSYLAGTVVSITANSPTAGNVFDAWTGDTVADASAASTTITMPAGAAAVTATYSASASFTLTVVSGTGGGNFAAATVNPIVANAPAAGHVFDVWTGGGGAVANPAASSTTVTMPSSALTVTATYVPGPFYTLTVNSGSGDGSYLAGTVVNIVADAPPAGKVFNVWTGGTVASASSPSTTVTMPAANVSVTATYVNNPATYTLIVNNGTGDGNYAQGTVVTITADAPPTGQVFSTWTGGTVASPTSGTTTVTMPAAAVTVTATYTSVFSATFYVATTGNNANPGTFSSPFRTINFGMSRLTAGATLAVRGGTYPESIENPTIASGTSWANKVRVVAYPGETVWITPSGTNFAILFNGNQSYIELDGINVDGSGALLGNVVIGFNNALPNQPRFIRIQNAEISDVPGGVGSFAKNGVELAAKVPVVTGGIELRYLTIHGNGRPGVQTSDNGYGVYIAAPNNLVEFCDIYDNKGAEIQVFNDDGAQPDNNIIRNNTLHDETRPGFAPTSCGIIVVGSNNKIYNNLIYNIVASSAGGDSDGIAMYSGDGNQILDNTITQNLGIGVQLFGGASNTLVQNNISYANSAGNYANAGTATTHNHNIDTGTNPLFVNAGALDFNLQGGSPAQGTGVGISFIDTDILGRARPTSGACDIGAYETP